VHAPSRLFLDLDPPFLNIDCMTLFTRTAIVAGTLLAGRAEAQD
jgi:hypothetical protein